MITIYHNAACSKSIAACELLQKEHQEVRIINYLVSPPEREELMILLQQLGLVPSELIRKGEPVFKQLYERSVMSEEDYLHAMLDHPVLMERPIVVKDGKAIIARPPERIWDLL